MFWQPWVTRAALLAYEPFANAPGTALIGSSDGSGFSGAWQDYMSSQGVATNTSYGLSFVDGASNRLVTAGGAGFFQGLTSANNSMQPIRLFNFSRGTNGTDGVTTWISFLIVRQGPTGTLSGNPYGRGANIDHDLNSGNLQKLAVGNSSGANTNTVGLIPLGNSANLKSSTIPFGNFTNFVVVRIDHRAGANDNAWLFVNRPLNVEPSTNSADASSLGGFDFSFDRLRVFVGGENGTAQHYAEIVLDEYRVGETYADVTPYTNATPAAPPAAFMFTNSWLVPGGIVLAGIGGSNFANYHLLAGADLAAPVADWPTVATNAFDANGKFHFDQSARARFVGTVLSAAAGSFDRADHLKQPTNLTVMAGQSADFTVIADGSQPLSYQWFYNTNTALPGGLTATLTIANAQFQDAGAYSVRVSNGAGSITSAVAVLTVLGPPVILLQPANQSTFIGSNATFTVLADGTPPLGYQWYFNTNTVLPGATNSQVTILNAQTNDAGTYSVIVTNIYGAATSVVARLTVFPPLISGAFFVSPTGSDSNPGTVTSPFLTINKGLTAIGTNGVLYLRGGTYAQSAKLSLNRIGPRTEPSACGLIRARRR